MWRTPITETPRALVNNASAVRDANPTHPHAGGFPEFRTQPGAIKFTKQSP